MKFRPCIDIHNGKVKQIVGSSLSEKDGVSSAKNNFVSSRSAGEYAKLYKTHGLFGGHVVMLNAPGDSMYEETLAQAKEALSVFPGGLQIGGSINHKNAADFIALGASHVVVTSFVFHEGLVDMDKLKSLCDAVGPEKIVLDLSVKKVENDYHVATERWQNISKECVNLDLFERLSPYCSEFLIHGADVEGKRRGIDEDLVSRLSAWEGKKIIYAGGIGNLKDIEKIREISGGKLDFTVGSALDLFGGPLKFGDVIKL